MEQYINKSAVVAAIRNKVDSYRGGGIISISVLKQHCEDFIDSLDSLEVKEVDLTWQDIKDIAEIGNDFLNSEDSNDLNDEEYYTGILKRFIGKKGGES